MQDTEFLDRGKGQAGSGMGDMTEGFQVYEDTNFFSMPATGNRSPPPSDENRGPHGPRSSKEWVADQENSVPGAIHTKCAEF